MSSSTGPAEEHAPPAKAARLAWALQAALVAAYLVLAHLASVGGDGRHAALALLAIVLLVLVPALLRGRARAWLALAACAALLWRLAPTPWPWQALRLVPAAFVAVVGYGFARTLRAGRVPLIARIVVALDGVGAEQLPDEVRRYARRLTLAWALLLAALALFDLWMALHATPEQWSWLANIGDYVVILGFMLAEFAYRKRRFPGQPRSFLGFLKAMLALGPRFWRSVAAP